MVEDRNKLSIVEHINQPVDSVEGALGAWFNMLAEQSPGGLDEVYSRDTAHGLLAWAFATVLAAVLLASPATTVLSGATSGVATGATASAAQAGPADGYIDALLRPSTRSGDGNSADARGELSRTIASSLRAGELKPVDRVTSIKSWPLAPV